jgi:hypothetical protein
MCGPQAQSYTLGFFLVSCFVSFFPIVLKKTNVVNRSGKLALDYARITFFNYIRHRSWMLDFGVKFELFERASSLHVWTQSRASSFFF